VHGECRSAPRYRTHRSGLAPVAAQLAVPVVLGLLVGGVLAYQAGSTNNAVQPVPLGAVPTPTPSFGEPSASTATAPATAAPSPAAITTITGQRGIVVPVNPLSARRIAALHQLTGQ
jgi:xanthine/uracil permease